LFLLNVFLPADVLLLRRHRRPPDPPLRIPDGCTEYPQRYPVPQFGERPSESARPGLEEET